LTTEEALKLKVADLEADGLDELRQKLGLSQAEVRRLHMSWAEQVVRFLTHPVIASLLMTFAMLGLLIELRTPGFGIPGIVGFLSLVAFFWGHFLVELAGWEQLVLVVLGLGLLAGEVFVLPGFGVAGVLGILALLAGLSSSLFGAGASLSTIVLAVSRVAISTAAALVGGVVLMRFLPLLPGGRRLVLATALPAGGRAEGSTALSPGTVGTALSPLRPAGIASFNGQRIDVVSRGDFIESGDPVEVVRDDGNRVVVKLGRPTATKGTSE
jgi:membrane-bound serine protease (ClpP class)